MVVKTIWYKIWKIRFSVSTKNFPPCHKNSSFQIQVLLGFWPCKPIHLYTVFNGAYSQESVSMDGNPSNLTSTIVGGEREPLRYSIFVHCFSPWFRCHPAGTGESGLSGAAWFSHLLGVGRPGSHLVLSLVQRKIKNLKTKEKTRDGCVV